MSLDCVVEKLSGAYKSTKSFVKREMDYSLAALYASYALTMDAVTTIAFGSETPVYEINPITKFAMNEFGVNNGMALSTILSIGLALPLSYALNKITKKPIGTAYLFVLAGVRLLFSASNFLQAYYINSI